MANQKNSSNQDFHPQDKIQLIDEKLSEGTNRKFESRLSEQTLGKQNRNLVLNDIEKASNAKEEIKIQILDRCKRGPIKFFMTGEMSKYYGREIYLKTMLKEALTHALFLAVLSILVFEYSSSDIGMFISSMVDKYILNEINSSQTLQVLTFNKVNIIDHIWTYLNSLVDIFHASNFFISKSNLSNIENLTQQIQFHDSDLIGLPRLRTVRVKNESCTVAKELNRLNIPCFSYYSTENEDTQPFGLKIGSAWNHKTATETGIGQVNGMVSSYPGSGYFQDFPKLTNEFKTILGTLKTEKWIDRATRAVTVDFTIYNVNLDVFAILNLLFEIPPTGGVISSYSIVSLKITDYSNKNSLYFGCVLAFLFLILFYTLQGLSKLIYFKWNFFKSVCNILDFSIIILCYLVFIINIQKNVVFKLYTDEVLSDDTKFANFNQIIYWEKQCNLIESALVFLSWVKLLKYTCMNNSIHRLQITLQASLKNIVWYSVIFLYILFTFAFTAYILFGSQIESYNTLSSSILTILQVYVKDFNYNSIKMFQPYLGPIFVFILLFSVCLIFVVVYIAILMSAYTETTHKIRCTSQEMKIGDVLESYLVDLVKTCSYKIAIRLKTYFNKRKIQKEFQGLQCLLKRYGFTQLEIETILEKYEISKDKISTTEDFEKNRTYFQKQEMSKLDLVRKIVRQNVAEKLIALEEAVSIASEKIILILKIFDFIELKLSSKQ